MDGRQRVRRHLAGRDADRPPLIVFATEFAARLEQVQARELWDDAGLLTRTLMGLQALFGLEAVVVDVPLVALHPDRVPTVADGVARIRALVGDRAALVLAVPGPLSAAAATGRDRAPETLEDLGAEILGAVKRSAPSTRTVWPWSSECRWPPWTSGRSMTRWRRCGTPRATSTRRPCWSWPMVPPSSATAPAMP